MALAAPATGMAVAAQGEEARVRVVHASPDAPAVDVFVDGERAIEGLAFGSATDFVPLAAGDYEVDVAPAGGAIEDAVISAELSLEGGTSYEVAAVGLLEEIAAQVYPIDTSRLAAGQARVRVIHASPDAGPVDVAVTGGPVLFAGAEFPNATDYAEVDAGSYDLEVRAAGTETVALAVPGVALAAGTVYDVFAIGLAEDGSLSVLPLTAEAGTARVSQMPNTGAGIGAAAAGAGWSALAAALTTGALLAAVAARRAPRGVRVPGRAGL